MKKPTYQDLINHPLKDDEPLEAVRNIALSKMAIAIMLRYQHLLEEQPADRAMLTVVKELLDRQHPAIRPN
jgi:hypothetical protein